MRVRIFFWTLNIFLLKFINAQCDSNFTYFPELPSNVTILVGDTCLNNNDIIVLDSLISINNLLYDSPLEIGTQTWFNGRLRFFVAGNYGNSSGVNDTIYTLPDNFGDLTNLASLYLEWNRIAVLPESFQNLSSLLSLYINNNNLNSLNENIGSLTNLFFLDLGYNQIETIPESICNLENLSYLWLFNNYINSIPSCICDMNLEWDQSDQGGYPYFAIGGNALCDSVPGCVSESENFELSLDQFYYSFPIINPQDCDENVIDQVTLPYQFNVSNAYPNPFNPSTSVVLDVPYDRKFNMKLYDLLGNEIDQIVKNKTFLKGKHIIKWSGENYVSGIYFMKISDGMNVRTIKLMLLK